jgi:hypothetical protein
LIYKYTVFYLLDKIDTTMSYPAPYTTYEGRKRAATIFQPYVSTLLIITVNICESITVIDRAIYSPEFRLSLLTALQNVARPDVLQALESAELTRTHLYRFFMKGSNVIPILRMYFDNKFKQIRGMLEEGIVKSDWDTTILINPDLPQEVFNILFENLVQILQVQLIQLSNTLSNKSSFISQTNNAINFGKYEIERNNTCAEFRKYPITFKHTDTKPRYIKLFNEPAYVDKKALSLALGPVGQGLIVSSDRNTAGLNKFYLGRILVHVVASKDIPIPVELLDVSINYQNDDLRYAWESHSEYRISFINPIIADMIYSNRYINNRTNQFDTNTIDFRIISPTSLYADLQKCILNAECSNNQTRKNKIPKRFQRIKTILDEMIIPYGSRNEVMSANLERHLQSSGPVGNVFRNLNRTLRNTRRQQRTYDTNDDDTNNDDST